MVRGAYLVVFAVLAVSAGWVRAEDGSHEKAVKEFFTITNVRDTYQKSVDMMLEMQIKNNPRLEQFRPVMKSFFDKYLKWEAVEPKMVQMYKDSFTEEELRNLIAFFSTPTGKKWAGQQSDLMLKGAKIGQEQTEAHLPELRKMITDQIERAQGGAVPAPDAAPGQ